MRQIFVNLPVKDLGRSKDFFAGLGFGFDPKFTDDNAACMVIEKDSIYAKRTSEVLLAVSCSSDHEVDDLVKKASSSGGKPVGDPKDHGFMYYRAFEDPDGHIWELLHMRPNGEMSPS
jgi:predicted lactoylglutathione lyase